MKWINIIFSLLLLFLVACQSSATGEAGKEDKLSTESEQMQAEAESLATSLAKVIEAHGGDLYDQAYYSFVFRGKTYTFRNDGPSFIYTRSEEKAGQIIVDSLTNAGITRHIDGQQQTLTEKQKASYAEGVNSVIYFATLPHKLRDPAVIVKELDKTMISGQEYAVLAVNFKQEGGGTDFEDNYRYWINAETNRIDYLAYDYQVNGGGVRFRAAYNPRVVEGILFQDYVNYKAAVGTALDDLPGMFEAGALEELSRIETKNVRKL